jgi:uncharacterized protein (TIGR03437 family)
MLFAFFCFAGLAVAGEFTTSLGDANTYIISAIAADSAGNTYVVGSRALPGTPTTISIISGTLSTSINSIETNGTSDVFVSKLDPNGKLLFTDTFSGKGYDAGTAIAVDPSGNIYIAGNTSSDDFPLSNALQRQMYTAGATGLIIKLTGDGLTVLYSTYFGGTLGQSSITGLATDVQGNLYVTGATQASDFPHTSGMPFGNLSQNPPSTGAIVASISAAGDKILYSGAIAGGSVCNPADSALICNVTGWEGIGIGIDAAGNAYIAGDFQAGTPPTASSMLPPSALGAFVAKVNAGGLGYLSYLGPPFPAGSNNLSLTTLYAMAVDAAGDVYLAGDASPASNLPITPGAYQPAGAGGFLEKLDPAGSAIWATSLDGALPLAIAVDGSGNVWATGNGSPRFPNANGWTSGDEFLARTNAAGSNLTYSAQYPSGTVGRAVSVDPAGLVHVAGPVGFVSAIAPGSPPAMSIFGFENAAGNNSMTASVSPAEVIAIFGPGIGPAAAVSATPVNGFYPTTLAGVRVAINGVDIPLFYASANQINAVLPMELTANAGATVQVTNGTTVSAGYPVWILPSAPGGFVATNQDGTVNSTANPATGGSIVTFYVTGWESNFAPLKDGQVATVAQDICMGACQASAVYYPTCAEACTGSGSLNTSITAKVLYAGAAPGQVAGVSQLNVQVGDPPASSGLNLFTVTVTGGPGYSALSQEVWIVP